MVSTIGALDIFTVVVIVTITITITIIIASTMVLTFIAAVTVQR